MQKTEAKINRKTEAEILELLPDGLKKVYRHKENTILLVDKDGNYILHDNGDGTYSGFDHDLFYNK